MAVSISNRALMINVNKPSVKRFIGSVNASIIGLIKTLIIPITNAANKAAQKPEIVNPGTIQATSNKASANNTHRTIKFNISILLVFQPD